MSKLRNTVYYEFRTIDNPNEVKQVGTRLLGTTTINTGIDTVPTLSMTIPLEDLPTEELGAIGNGTYVEPRLQRYTIIVYFNIGGVQKYRFQGTIDKMNIDYATYSVQINLSHTVARMREWAMPVNYTVKSKRIEDIVGQKGAALGYANPPLSDIAGYNNFSMQSYDRTIDFVFDADGAADVPVTMTFGANNKLQALGELLNNTEDLHFAVDLSKERDTVLISSFTQAPCTNIVISPYTYTEEECEDEDLSNFVTMLTEPKFNIDYTNHFNRAIVFCGDIQDGVHHLTLEQYYSGALTPLPGFPVNKYEYDFNQQPEAMWDDEGKKINNEKIYKNFDIIAYSKNDNREFYVEDTKQLEEDRGIILNTVYNFTDLYPIPSLKKDIDDDGEMEELVITDGDRAEIVRQAYLRAVRKLKAQRPQRVYQMNTTALPRGVRDGDKIRLQYAKAVQVPDDEWCGDFEKKKIINIDECLYLTKRTITFDDVLNEVTTVTLDAELRVKDISPTEVELREDAADEVGQAERIHSDLGRRNYNIDVYSKWSNSMLRAPDFTYPNISPDTSARPD